jgi:hypothetical protein
MVIINYKGGQLANRILSFAHFAANSIEYGYALYNPEFDEYNQYFDSPNKNDFKGHPISITLFKNHFLDRVFSRIFRLWADISHPAFSITPIYTLYRIFKSHDRKSLIFDLNNKEFVQAAINKRVITEGWLFRDYSSFEKHQELLRQFFTPIEKYRQDVDKLISIAKAKADIIVGVHIRRGDYIRYAGGQWFFSDEVYADKMKQVQTHFNRQQQRCVFLICTNDSVNDEKFNGLDILTDKRHFITDMYSLAACDCIIGPPSTFSIWASFYGKVPLTQIFSKEDIIQIGSYKNLC